jgi:hypothetical protein
MSTASSELKTPAEFGDPSIFDAAVPQEAFDHGTARDGRGTGPVGREAAGLDQRAARR